MVARPMGTKCRSKIKCPAAMQVPSERHAISLCVDDRNVDRPAWISPIAAKGALRVRSAGQRRDAPTLRRERQMPYLGTLRDTPVKSAPLARYRPRYPFPGCVPAEPGCVPAEPGCVPAEPGCVPAEPESVFPGTINLCCLEPIVAKQPLGAGAHA